MVRAKPLLWLMTVSLTESDRAHASLTLDYPSSGGLIQALFLSGPFWNSYLEHGQTITCLSDYRFIFRAWYPIIARTISKEMPWAFLCLKRTNIASLFYEAAHHALHCKLYVFLHPSIVNSPLLIYHHPDHKHNDYFNCQLSPYVQDRAENK